MWYTDPTPEFSWNSVYDTLSGTFGYRYTIDHDSKTLLTSSDPFTEATTFSQSTPLSGGTWYFHVAAVDNAHNIGNVSFDFQINIDTTPPEVDIDVNSYPLRIGATDEHSGVQTVFFRVDDKDWQIGTEVRFSISGSHIVEFYATDQLNNTSAVESVKFTYSPGSKWSWNRIKQQQEEQEALATEQEAIKKSKEEYEKQELERPYSFENLKVFYAFDKALISWNNVNTSIDYFVVYRCALTDPDCQKPTVVAQIQSNSEKRMRVIDRIGGQHYYRVFGYFADDQILEKSEVVFYKQSFERKTLLKNKKEVGKL